MQRNRRSILVAIGGLGSAGAANAGYPTATSAEWNRTGRAQRRPPFIDIVEKYKLKGDWDPGDRAKIQAAFDNEPAGATLWFSPLQHKLTAPLRMHKAQNIVAYGAIFWGNFGSATDDVLMIAITDAGSASDVRGLSIRGGTYVTNPFASAPTLSCKSAISINGRSGGSSLPVLGLSIADVYCAGGRGPDIHFIGEVGHSTIDRVQCVGDFAGVHLDGTPDHNRVMRSLLGGSGDGVIVDIQEGAFNTLVGWNTIVRGGAAVRITNGSQVKIVGNQIEQKAGDNTAPESAHIVIAGAAYTGQRNCISGNNFGLGANVGNAIVLQNARNTMLDENTFGPLIGAGADIVISPTAAYTRIGPNNLTRDGANGANAASARGAIRDPSMKLIVHDGGEGTSGIVKDATSLSLQNGWSATMDFGFFKSDCSATAVVRFRGGLVPGARAAGMVIGNLPRGFRPVGLSILIVPALDETQANTAVVLTIGPDGVISLRELCQSTVKLLAVHAVSLPIIGEGSYVPGV